MMRPSILALVAAALTCGPALATGGLVCESVSGEASFALRAGISHGSPYPFLGLGGELVTGFTEIRPDLREAELGSGNLVQWWFDPTNINLQFQILRREGYPDATTLTIKTTWTDEDFYEGTFVVTAYEPPEGGDDGSNEESRGTVRCYVE